MIKKLIKIYPALLILSVIIISFSSCKNSPTIQIVDTKYSSRQSWYSEVIHGFKQREISKNVAESDAAEEYRVVYDVALQRYDYYSLQVFENGKGLFTYMVHKSEDFKTGKIVLKKTKKLTVEETQKLIIAINENDFWNIPTVHPDEKIGCDGTAIFIEGYSKNKTHFISMWEAGEKHGIFKIHKAFSDFADTIAKRPVIRFD